MARIADLPLKHRLFLLAYPFRSLDPVPWTRLSVPLREARVALVTTAAFHAPGDEPFNDKALGGDASFRVLEIRDRAQGTSLGELEIGHRSTAFDAAGIEADYNLAVPADRLLELEREGAIGSLHREALSFMGSITAPRRLLKKTAPRAAERLRAGGVDAVLLSPV